MPPDDFEMENQGYEDEVSHATVIKTNSSRGSRKICTIDVPSIGDESDYHVYEDIAIFIPENTLSSDGPPISSLPQKSIDENETFNDESKSSNRSNGVRTNSDESRRSSSKNSPPTVSSSSIGFGSRGNFHRNLTLPFPVPNLNVDGDAFNGIRRSVRAIDAEMNGHFSRETSIATSKVVDEMTTTTTTTVDVPVGIDKTGRRRRKKKDCKRCRNKENVERTSIERPENFATMSNVATIFPVDAFTGFGNGKIMERRRNIPEGKFTNFGCELSNRIEIASTIVRENDMFAISKSANDSSFVDTTMEIDRGKSDIDVRLVSVCVDDERTSMSPGKNCDDGMRVNSIYSQEHWHCREESPIFVTNVEDRNDFQRAYSLPTRSQSPPSQNRVNVRKNVRGKPPPHPARLRKNRHGWTLDFSRPLDVTGCTKSIILLLTAILALLGIGGIALYIVFEPEKLQIIQQYLRSSSSLTVSAETEDELDGIATNLETEPTVATNVSTASALLTEGISAFTRRAIPYSKTETELASTAASGRFDVNVTRHCDDCWDGEVCVALVDEEVPFCRNGPDPLDPTGCAGLCLINKQKCHRLDVDAFRCVKVDNYCLDDEWMCSNTHCIHSSSRCDGHMNCYDHSDEYDCACNLQTHFRCGNETSCLPLDRRCDGKIDCWDATDEINCTLTCPSNGDFTCSNGECILKARFCDGLRDCTDGSDEPHGCQGRCNKHEFSCHNGRCITKSMRCNDIDDCDDNSDEQHCKYMIKR